MSAKLLPPNVGPVDRTLRVLLGIVLLALVFTGPHTPWGWLGLVPLLTGIVGSCPLYRVFGRRTTPAQPPRPAR